MTTDYKVTELFCIIDEFCKHFDAENAGNLLEDNSGVKRRRRQASLSDSEIMTILLYFHFGTFRNFKHYYLFFIKGTMKSYFPKAVSYNRFVELESRVFFQLMFFLNLGAFGRCTGITFVDSTMIPVCHNLRRYANKVFKGIATDGKGTMGWCHGFKLHLACNDRGEIIAFVLTGANVSDKDPNVFKVIAKDVQTSETANGNYQLQGIYTQKEFSKDVDNNCYIVKGNKLMNPAKLLENTNVKKVVSKPFRAYMVDKSSSADGAKMFSIGFDDDSTTAIDTLNTIANDKAEYYDLQGKRLNEPQKGINIVKRGNKTMKVIIK